MNASFPILQQWRTAADSVPAYTIPLALIQEHEAQAKANTGLPLDALERAGGITSAEAVAIIEDRPFRVMPLDEAIQTLARHVADWEKLQP